MVCRIVGGCRPYSCPQPSERVSVWRGDSGQLDSWTGLAACSSQVMQELTKGSTNSTHSAAGDNTRSLEPCPIDEMDPFLASSLPHYSLNLLHYRRPARPISPIARLLAVERGASRKLAEKLFGLSRQSAPRNRRVTIRLAGETN